MLELSYFSIFGGLLVSLIFHNMKLITKTWFLAFDFRFFGLFFLHWACGILELSFRGILVSLISHNISTLLNCKVAIPRGTGRSYGIRWRSGMRVTDGTKVTDGRKDERTDGRMEGWTDGRANGRKDGTYSAGVKDSASAYVLCPRLTEQLCLSIWKGIGKYGKEL